MTGNWQGTIKGFLIGLVFPAIGGLMLLVNMNVEPFWLLLLCPLLTAFAAWFSYNQQGKEALTASQLNVDLQARTTNLLNVNEQLKRLSAENQRLSKTVLQDKQEWGSTFDAVDDFIMITDEMGIIFRCNQAMANFLERDYAEIVGKPIESFWPESLFGGRRLDGALEKPIQFSAEDIWFIVSGYPLARRGADDGVIYLFSDITGIIQSTIDLDKAIEDQSIKFKGLSGSAVSGLVDIISRLDHMIASQIPHDLFKEVLPARKDAEDIAISLNNFTNLTNMDRGELILISVPFSLSTLIEESVLALLPNLYQNRAVQINVMPEWEINTHLIGDVSKLRDVVYALVRYILEHAKTGDIHVKTEIKEDQPERVHIKLSIALHNGTQRSISRSTSLYDAELGLSTAEGLIALMGGELIKIINDDTIIGFTTELWFTKGGLLPQTPSIRDGYRKNVLLICPSSPQLETIEGILSHLGLHVTPATNWDAALSSYQTALEHNLPPKILMVDLDTPGIPPEAILPTINAWSQSEEVSVVGIEFAWPFRIERLSQLGFARSVQKPVFQREIIEIIADLAQNLHPKRFTNEPIDLTELRARFSESDVSLNLIVLEFIDFLNGQVPQFGELYHTGDLETIRHTAHNLSGMARNFCAYRLADIAEVMESQSFDTKGDELNQLLSQLEDEYQLVLRFHRENFPDDVK